MSLTPCAGRPARAVTERMCAECHSRAPCARAGLSLLDLLSTDIVTGEYIGDPTPDMIAVDLPFGGLRPPALIAVWQSVRAAPPICRACGVECEPAYWVPDKRMCAPCSEDEYGQTASPDLRNVDVRGRREA